MGYTHYWNIIDPKDEKFDALSKDVKVLLNRAEVKPLVEGIVTDERIAINGIGDDAHEDFWFSRTNNGYEFCKTARKPYDATVTVCLLLIKHHYGWDADISSDGRNQDGSVEEEFQDGRDLFSKIFGYPVPELSSDI